APNPDSLPKRAAFALTIAAQSVDRCGVPTRCPAPAARSRSCRAGRCAGSPDRLECIEELLVRFIPGPCAKERGDARSLVLRKRRRNWPRRALRRALENSVAIARKTKVLDVDDQQLSRGTKLGHARHDHAR